MPDSPNPRVLVETLRSQVEDLASRLILEGPVEGEWMAVLDQICKESEASATEAALTAAELKNQLGRSQDAAVREGMLTRGIARLRKALDDELSLFEAPPATEQPGFASLAADPELMRDFVLESREHLDNVEVQLLTNATQGQPAQGQEQEPPQKPSL